MYSGEKGTVMPFQTAVRFVSLAVVLLFPVWAKAQLNTEAEDRSEVVQTIRTFFNALETNDEAQFTSVVTPDYYSFSKNADSSHSWSVVPDKSVMRELLSDTARKQADSILSEAGYSNCFPMTGMIAEPFPFAFKPVQGFHIERISETVTAAMLNCLAYAIPIDAAC